MATDRRSFLQWFGVGAVVAPVVNGLAMADNHALIVEPPKVEIAKPPEVIQVDGSSMFMSREVLALTVFARSPSTGKVFRMDCDAFISKMSYKMPVAGRMMQEAEFLATGPVQFAEWRDKR